MKKQMKNIGLGLCLGLLTTVAVGSFTGCAGDENTRSTGQYMDDKTLQHQVRDALSDNGTYKFDNVNVDVYRGTVQLSGFVQTGEQKDKAYDISKNVQGVSKVDNKITVKSNE